MKLTRWMAMGNHIWMILLLAVLAAPLATAYAGPRAEKTIKVLKLGATSNFADRQGIEFKKCLELLAEQLNKAGGLVIQGEPYHVEMIIYDDKYQPDVGRAAFERLVYQDKVKAIFSIGTAPTLAGIEVTEPNKVPVLHGAFSPKLYDPKYKYALCTRPNTVGLTASAVFWKKQTKRAQLKTVAIIANDDLAGVAVSGTFAAVWKHCGVSVLDRLYSKRGTVDFNPLAAKVKSLNPDIIEYAGIQSGAPVLNLFKAIYQSGWRGQTSAELAQTTVPDIVNVCGKEAAEGMYVKMYDPTVIPNPPSLAIPFRDAYTKKYAGWEVDGLRVVAGWFFFIEAVKKANSLDPDAIVHAIQGMSVETLFGTSRMCRRPDLGNGRYVDNSCTTYFGQVRDGKVVYLDRVSAIDGISAAEEIIGGGKWQ